MKKGFLTMFFCLALINLTSAQGVGINEDNSAADNSAILDIKSTTKGVLVPRLTQAQRNSIANPATGLMVFQTDNTSGFYYYNGTTWAAVGGNGGGSVPSGSIVTSEIENDPTLINAGFTLFGKTTQSMANATTYSTDTWEATATSGAPSARRYHTATWTGSVMIIWGGHDGTSVVNTGGRYSAETNSWSSMPTSTNVPTARQWHTSVMAGAFMIVWGGHDGTAALNTGARYSTSNNTWSVVTTTGAPTARYYHTGTAFYDGNTTHAVIWGGTNGTTPTNTGARYTPGSDKWTTITTTTAPTARYNHIAVIKGNDLIIHGGMTSTGATNTIAKYPLSALTGTWTTLTASNTSRQKHTVVQSDTDFYVYGGNTGTGALNTGEKYNFTAGTWTNIANSTTARVDHTAVWTGSKMFVWGGNTGSAVTNTGEIYDPATDTWTSVTTTGAPTARQHHTMIWTGTYPIVWGGANNSGNVVRTGAKFFATGAYYNTAADKVLYHYKKN